MYLKKYIGIYSKIQTEAISRVGGTELLLFSKYSKTGKNGIVKKKSSLIKIEKINTYEC